jgi:hypothetical protein
MTKYLRVDIEGCVQGCSKDPVYTPLDDVEYTDEELCDIGQDAANEEHSWGYKVVDESEVPEGER